MWFSEVNHSKNIKINNNIVFRSWRWVGPNQKQRFSLFFSQHTVGPSLFVIVYYLSSCLCLSHRNAGRGGSLPALLPLSPQALHGACVCRRKRLLPFSFSGLRKMWWEQQTFVHTRMLHFYLNWGSFLHFSAKMLLILLDITFTGLCFYFLYTLREWIWGSFVFNFYFPALILNNAILWSHIKDSVKKELNLVIENLRHYMYLLTIH